MSERIEQIEARLNAATASIEAPAPWTNDDGRLFDSEGDSFGNCYNDYAAEFIVVVPDDVRWLIERVRALEADAARLDWMQEHGASVDVHDTETLPCNVQASDDYRLSGSAPEYDIRAAIDAARAAQAVTP